MDALGSLLEVGLRVVSVAIAVFIGVVLVGAATIIVIYGALFVLLGGAS